MFNANIHSLRKTAGYLLIESGVDIYRVSKFLNHSSVTVTEKHYADLLRKITQKSQKLWKTRSIAIRI
ncbi:MAG: tyrosine-type recombinase/integrase [Candidatus Neomarinimicrobiota bacterium]